jgi:hypothetical protein
MINKRPSDHSGGLSVFHDVGDVQRSAQSYVATAAKRWTLRGRLPPTSHRSHRYQAVDVARKITTDIPS